MRYFEAKVLVPMGDKAYRVAQWEGFLLHLHKGFHKGAPVQGMTREWGNEYMVPYYVAIKCSDTVDVSAPQGVLAHAIKDIFSEEAVYIAVTELAAPFIC